MYFCIYIHDIVYIYIYDIDLCTSIICCNGINRNLVCNVVQCNGMQWNAMERNGKDCNRMQWNVMEWNAMYILYCSVWNAMLCSAVVYGECDCECKWERDWKCECAWNAMQFEVVSIRCMYIYIYVCIHIIYIYTFIYIGTMYRQGHLHTRV